MRGRQKFKGGFKNQQERRERWCARAEKPQAEGGIKGRTAEFWNPEKDVKTVDAMKGGNTETIR